MEQYTEEQLIGEIAKRMGVVDKDIDAEYTKKIFADLKEVDGLARYLLETAAKDKDRYFGAATKEEQLIIRGGFARTMWLRNLIINQGKIPDGIADK